MKDRAAVVALLVAACAAPFLVSDFRVFQLTQILIYAIALLGLNLLTGFNGQISLGHGAFYGMGAYVVAILLDHAWLPYWVSVPMAGLVCFMVGFAFGLPALRLEGLYLALATFSLAIATPQILKYDKLESWTGGVQGIILSKPEPAVGWLNPDQWLYFFCLIFVVAFYLAGWNLVRGRTGRALIAIRDHPIAAASMGVDNAMYKSITFGISAMYTGIAGGLGALHAEFVSPDSFTVLVSINFLVGIVVGGIASIFGNFFGAAFIVFLPNWAEDISKAAPWAIYGVVLIVCMLLMPYGVAGVIRRLRARLR